MRYKLSYLEDIGVEWVEWVYREHILEYKCDKEALEGWREVVPKHGRLCKLFLIRLGWENEWF